MLDQDFVDDCPYGPGGLLLDDIVTIDAAESLVVARWPTHDDLPLTREQRAHPVRHPRHVSGGLMVHMTGMVGFAHAYFVLGLRHREGWIGYGAKIDRAKFHALAPPGEPILITCRGTQIRARENLVFAKYAFHFHQREKLVYEGDQTALWTRVASAAP